MTSENGGNGLAFRDAQHPIRGWQVALVTSLGQDKARGLPIDEGKVRANHRFLSPGVSPDFTTL